MDKIVLSNVGTNESAILEKRVMYNVMIPLMQKHIRMLIRKTEKRPKHMNMS